MRRDLNGTPMDLAGADLGPGTGMAPSAGSVMDVPLPPPHTPVGLGELAELSDGVFPPVSWLDGQSGSLVDHPLLRGLLMELPPKGVTPPPDWLNRWFEAARAILELLYVQGQSRR